MHDLQAILDAHAASLIALVAELYPGGRGNGTSISPYVIGPDVTHGGVQQGYMSAFLDGLAKPGVDVVTWHHYYTAGKGGVVTVSQYTDPAFLDTYVGEAKQAEGQFLAYQKTTNPAAQLWMGETAGAGGACTGSHQVIGKFVAVFWYADKLGAAAAARHSVVIKQEFLDQVVAVPGGGVTVTPEFWLSTMWRETMGRDVLSVGGDRGGNIRVYAHAGLPVRTSSNSSAYSSSNSTHVRHRGRRSGPRTRVSVVVINLGSGGSKVDLALSNHGQPSPFSAFQSYQLTVSTL